MAAALDLKSSVFMMCGFKSHRAHHFKIIRKLISMNFEEIVELTSTERIANYLFYLTKLAALGARLRKDERPDESWTVEETKEWDDVCDELEPWCYALSDREREAVDFVEEFVVKLMRGEIVTKT